MTTITAWLKMLTKKLVQQVKALEIKKERDLSGNFLAEGEKLVSEILAAGWPIERLFATPEWIELCAERQIQLPHSLIRVSPAELERISLLKSPRYVAAVVRKPVTPALSPKLFDDWTLFLDTVQDPGNMGTILRIADWFGIRHVVATPGSADAFQPKVVQSTMGAITRVTVYTLTASDFFSQKALLAPEVPVYGASLQGENLYGTSFAAPGVVVMGNESRGIFPETAGYINRHLFIPPFPPGAETSESLNVAVATAVICAEIRRQNYGTQNL